MPKNSIEPVSYTHLDVYKRQELSQAVYLKELEPGSGEGTGNGSGSAGGAVDGEGGLSSGYVELLSGAAAGLWIQGKAEKLVDHVTVKDAKAPDPSGNICLEVEYTERIPFLSLIHISLDVMVHVARMRDRSRKVTAIEEVVGIENGEIVLRPLFSLDGEGELRKAGDLRRQEKLRRAGYGL